MSRFLLLLACCALLLPGLLARADALAAAAISLIVSVREQAQVAVPAVIGFDVVAPRVATNSAPVKVAVHGIVLTGADSRLRLSLRADAGHFIPPQTGAPPWAAADVRWEAAPWQDADGCAGALSCDAFSEVALSRPGAAAFSTGSLVFTLAPHPAAIHAGTHSLQITWKVESLAP